MNTSNVKIREVAGNHYTVEHFRKAYTRWSSRVVTGADRLKSLEAILIESGVPEDLRDIPRVSAQVAVTLLNLFNAELMNAVEAGSGDAMLEQLEEEAKFSNSPTPTGPVN